MAVLKHLAVEMLANCVEVYLID